MFAGCLQIMWAHSHLIRAGGVGYSQIIRAENADVCRSYGLCLQATTIIYGLRTMEICGALKEEFDFEAMVWSAPPERIKNIRWLVLPITPLAKELIDKLWLYSGNSKYLFPGRFNESKTIHETSLAHAVDRIKGINKFSPRDLRRTVKTRMGEIGIEKSIRDRIQNHALNDVSSKHYDRYDYLPEKRSALLKWENYLLELTAKD